MGILQSGGWTLCADNHGRVGYVPSLVVPHGFQNSSGFLSPYVRAVAHMKKAYRTDGLTTAAGDPVVILGRRKFWSVNSSRLRTARRHSRLQDTRQSTGSSLLLRIRSEQVW